MFQIVLLCDRCNPEIARGNSALEIRRVSGAIYRRRGGEDLCMKCAGRERTRKMSNDESQLGRKKAAHDPKLPGLIRMPQDQTAVRQRHRDGRRESTHQMENSQPG